MIVDTMSIRVVSGEARGSKLASIIPDRIIAAGTEAEVSFYNSNTEKDSSNFEKINISYRIENKRYKIVKYRPLRFGNDIRKLGTVSYLNLTDKILCYTTGIIYGGYCWFVKFGSPSDEDYEGAKKKAAKIYKISSNEFDVIFDENQ